MYYLLESLTDSMAVELHFVYGAVDFELRKIYELQRKRAKSIYNCHRNPEMILLKSLPQLRGQIVMSCREINLMLMPILQENGFHVVLNGLEVIITCIILNPVSQFTKC